MENFDIKKLAGFCWEYQELCGLENCKYIAEGNFSYNKENKHFTFYYGNLGEGKKQFIKGILDLSKNQYPIAIFSYSDNLFVEQACFIVLFFLFSSYKDNPRKFLEKDYF